MMAENPLSEEAIFEVARKIDAGEAREAYLQQACGDDDALGQRVRALLRTYEKSDSFLEPPDPALSVTLERPAGERPGTMIGPYKLLQQIGEGGMGTVFMAQQTHPVQRKVALKIIKPGTDSRDVIARFEAERQALALMDHPNIAKVLDAGTTAEGRPYFVMELVKGLPITQYCDEKHLPLRDRLALFSSVCQAVQHAHQKGIIHRDLKPSNVLIALYDGVSVPKVIDFGVAKATGAKLTEKTLFTEFGQVVGTLQYMSPEQAEANQLDVDTRSDIYSLGVLLYELLTGTTPLERKRMKEAALLEVLRLIREEEPPRPSTRLSTTEGRASIAANRGLEPKKLSGLVRGELDWIVMKALEKDRNRRYETANGFAMDIQRYLNDEQVQACPPSAWYRFRKFVRRNKRPVLAASLVLLALVGGIIGTTWGMIRAKDAEADAVYEAGQKETALGEKEAALGTAKANEIEAKKQEELAKENEKTAKGHELLARRRLYAGQINLAMQAWDAGEPARVLELLESQRPKVDEKDLRTFEWYYLWRLVRRQHRQTLSGHKDTVSAVAYSPDGRLLASASHDGTVKLWDAVTAQELYTLTSHGGEVRTVAFSRDGMTLASGSRDRAITLWNVASRKEKATLTAAGPVRSVAFSPEGKTLASGDEGDCVKLWDVATGKELASLPQTRHVDSVAFSPDGKTLASAGHDWAKGHHVKLWALDGTTAKVRASLNNVLPHTHPNGGLGPPVVFSPDGKTLAAGFAETNLVEVGTGQVTVGHQLHRGDILSIALSPDGTILASAGMDRDVILWDVSRSRELARYVHAAPVYGVAFSPDGGTLASASEDTTVKLWDVSKAPERDMLEASTAVLSLYCGCLAFLPDSKTLLAGGTSVKLWDVTTGREKTTLQKEGGNVALSTDGRTLAYSSGSIAKVWDLASGQERASLRGHTAGIGSLDFSPDGKTLATGASDGMVILWDMSTGQQTDHKRYGYSVTRIAFSPDGKALVVGGESAMVQVWDTGSGNAPRVLQGQDYWDWVVSLTFSPDGRTLAVANCSGKIRLYDTATWKVRISLRGHMDELRGLAFFPDGQTLVSGGSDRTVKLWDVETGQERMTLTQPLGDRAFPLGDIRNKLTAVAVSPDGNTLASASADGVVKLWRAASDEEALARTTDLDPDDPHSPAAKSKWGDRRRDADRNHEAEEAYRQAMGRLEKLAGEFPNVPDYPLELAHNHFALGLLLGNSGRPQEADQAYRRAIDLFENVAAKFPNAPNYRYALAMSLNKSAWLLATTADPQSRDPVRAVELAKKAVELTPKEGNHWNTLGAAHYRASDWKAAIAALEKSLELRKGGDSHDWFFLAMAHWQLGNKDEARTWFDKAIGWLDKNQPVNEELGRYRGEAEALLEIKERKD